MSVIYQPKGKAGEYAKYALNLYAGCLHGCSYCYVPKILFKDRISFSATVTARKDILKLLENDCIKMGKTIDDNVLLSFTSDPYQPMANDITREALQILGKYKIPFTVLTKGGMRAERDFDLYTLRDCFATTLTFINDDKTKLIEPKAALFDDRFEAIKKAKQKDIITWASLEPVLDIEECFKIIAKTYEYIDLYKVGKSNYIESNIDWHKFVHEVIEIFEAGNKKYYIKEDLKKFI